VRTGAEVSQGGIKEIGVGASSFGDPKSVFLLSFCELLWSAVVITIDKIPPGL